ncbi:cyclic nucleotide-gated ion channel 1-like isoform X1 [Diospyros lotus]|uniref:cyclic nucleotide-gated ion channel 1-like isoform X1 n=1 Tax=Diospyros lotus TaxID=55363 RepID=UPI00224DC949|nr:cyclic nucleotide-gated ion channel 1-like isoform X1 [Diospyros lotus]XP_052192579.1 cyclic nucleotide-gated ion channel 1-like isoform X1 [Diospyros lotus]
MNSNRDRFVRFQDWSSAASSNSELQYPPKNGLFTTSSRSFVELAAERIRRGFERFFEWIKRFTSSSSAHRSDVHQPTKRLGARTKILDPQGAFLQKWNKIFVLVCVIAVSLDPLFFYIPVIDGKRKCLSLDRPLEITACVLRSFTDIFYVLHIIFQFRTGFIAPSSRVFGRGELIEDPYAIAKRYLSSHFIIDILSILPLPQVVILLAIPNIDKPVALITKELLKFVIFSQYIPRFIRIYPLIKEVTRTSGLFAETAWAGAAFNLLLYMLASHIVGAFWYLFTIERQESCWNILCERDSCDDLYLYCGKGGKEGVDKLFPHESCLLPGPSDIKNSSDFDFGIFLDALQTHIVETRDFPRKLFYCFWWGLRNLSSLGQNLRTSTFVGEILFAVFISILGLVLFSLLIGNMQKYLQSLTVRIEEMRVRRWDSEQWMSHRMLPENLRERIRQYDQYKWQETRGVEEQSLIQNLPKDIRRDIKRHMCWSLLTRVPIFEKMDEQLLDAMCDRLRPVLCTETSFILHEGDPVDEMIFVMRGNLLTMTTNGGRTGFFNCVHLSAGDFCGEELLTWALDPKSSSSLPSSTRTVKAITDVEAFTLVADDLKFVASQFRRLHSKQLQHTFRFCSHQWRAWAACFIQAAWRRHCRRKTEKSLSEKENRLQDTLANEAGTSPSLGATIYASKFATNALRALRRNHGRSPKLPSRLLLQKPWQPDFTAEYN